MTKLTWRDLDTPTLILDEEVLDRNLKRVQDHATQTGLALWPHIKTHKTPQLAHRQLDGGAQGLTVAKLGEAEVMADADCRNLFLANHILGRQKVERLRDLARRVSLRVCVDSIVAAQGLSEVFAHEAEPLPVVLEVETGANRCGVQVQQAPAMAAALSDLPGLKLVGIMTYAGVAYAGDSPEDIARAVAHEEDTLGRLAERLRADGYAIDIVSGGCTPGARFYSGRGLTEVRCGTYIFNDVNQLELGSCGRDDLALTVLATVVSHPTKDRAILDCGAKSMGTVGAKKTGVIGLLLDVPGAVVVKVSDEHGIADLSQAERDLKIGEKVRVVPSRVNHVVNLHEEMFLYRGGDVLDRLAIAGRGKFR